jgi:hypothetical protein
MYRGILKASFLFGNSYTRFDKTTRYSVLVCGLHVEK